MGAKSQILRDARLRFSVEANEVKRRALLYIARNTTLESQVRHRAQLQLANMEGSTRPGRVSNRCTETGRGRGQS
jgi:small subunit ribosomal protein S14